MVKLGAEMMVTESFRVAVAPAASVAVIVKAKVPPAVGVPVMAPVPAFRLSPLGRAPVVIAKVTGAVPLVTATVCA